MITEREVETVRRMYAALAVRDFVTLEGCFAADVLWRLPGRSQVSGTHIGWAAIRDDFLAKLGPLSGGTFKAELVDVAVGREHVAAVQHATAEHGGRRLDITGCQLMTLVDGRIAEVRGHYSDQEALDAFWGPGA